MSIVVDIADRLYDYTDEEKAAEAVAEFQEEYGLKDGEVLALWTAEKNDTKRIELERRIFDAVDANGSVARARQAVPDGITLAIEDA